MNDYSGNPDPTRNYFKCTECDVTCGNCKAQDSKGVVGDKGKCTSCGYSFPYFVLQEEACYVNCAAGYYTKLLP